MRPLTKTLITALIGTAWIAPAAYALDVPQVHQGTLTNDDDRLPDNSPADIYTVNASEGDVIKVSLTSDEYDTYVLVGSDHLPRQLENDDLAQGITNSELTFIAPADGEYRIVATCYDPDARGNYTLTISEGDAADVVQSDLEGGGDQGGPQTYQGTLTDDDERLDDNSPADLYTFTANEGDEIVIDLRSTQVDTYLAVGGDALDQPLSNDDATEGSTNSQITFTAPATGEYIAIASCYDPEARGDYELVITGALGGDGAPPAAVSRLPEQGLGAGLPITLGENGFSQTGELTGNDARLINDSPYDVYAVHLDAGQTIAVDLHSTDLDPYLIVTSDLLDEELVNDDYNDSRSHSRVSFTAPQAGVYNIVVNCYAADGRGQYELSLSEALTYTGELAQGDEQLNSDEYIDWYEIECASGEMLLLELNGVGFDTYLILHDPSGNAEENDDAGSTLVSRITTNIFQPGTYRIGVTSYESGETGSYNLSISTTVGYIPAPIQGGTFNAEFDGSEASLEGNGFVDAYSFHAEAGTTVIITMSSDDVDTFLKIKGPGKINELNDDYNAENTNSQMAFRVSETGTYYLTATTFQDNQQGNYQINLQLDASKYDAGEWAVQEAGTIYGVFVGIADYPGDGDLPYCDEDARNIARVFNEHMGMSMDNAIVLTDDLATSEVVAQAVRDLAAKAGPNDMFVFFYSGHGDQEIRSAPDFADPDGLNETLSLYDSSLSDDAFADILDSSNAGTTLVVIDACFSGGFAKDVVSSPGRIGIFSSEGDCLSMVAGKYEAGGYLSLFFTQAFDMHTKRIDLNGDDMMTVHELTYYLQVRFDEIVRSDRQSQPSRLYPSGAIDPGGNLGYQRIVSDRDGVSPHLILTDW